MLLEILLALLVLIALFYWRNTRQYGVFASHGIPEPPKRFPFGTLVSSWKLFTGKVNFIYHLNELYHTFGRNVPYLGTFVMGRPILVLCDIDIIKRVLISDFDHFADRRHVEVDESSESNRILANMPTMIRGEKWRRTRSTLSPAFTSGKLKVMTPLFQQVGEELSTYLNEIEKRDEEFNAKELMMRYTVDCIASAGFGIDGKAIKEPDGTFMKMAIQASGNSRKTSLKRKLQLLVWLALPWLAKLLKFQIRDDEAILFFADVMKKSIKMRKDNATKRHDLIDLIKDAMENNEELQAHEVPGEDFQFEKDASLGKRQGGKIDNEEFELLMIANGLTMFLAGFETSSTTLSVCLAFLSKNPHLQEKLMKEIREALANNDGKELNYHQIQELVLLDMVIMETLRFYNVLYRNVGKGVRESLQAPKL